MHIIIYGIREAYILCSHVWMHVYNVYICVHIYLDFEADFKVDLDLDLDFGPFMGFSFPVAPCKHALYIIDFVSVHELIRLLDGKNKIYSYGNIYVDKYVVHFCSVSACVRRCIEGVSFPYLRERYILSHCWCTCAAQISFEIS